MKIKYWGPLVPHRKSNAGRPPKEKAGELHLERIGREARLVFVLSNETVLEAQLDPDQQEILRNALERLARKAEGL